MITCEQDNITAAVLEVEDLFARLLPFRVFRISDHKTEPKPVYGSVEWIMSTKLFPARFVKVKNVYDSDCVKVKLFQDKQSRETVAIKFIKKFEAGANEKLQLRQDRINRELFIMTNVHHPYIVKVKEILSLVDCFAIVMEYAAGGELFEHVHRNTKLSESEARRLMFQIFLAVDYLHAKGIVHRDLKLENILLDENCQVKIADFGFANIFEEENQILKTSCGSPSYAAPEIVLNNQVSAPVAKVTDFSKGGYKGPAVDIWSCGVIMFAMLFGHLPFEDQAYAKNSRKSSLNVYHLYQYIANHTLSIPGHTRVSPEAVDLLKGLLKFDPNKRLNLTQIFRHLWFANASLK